MTRKKFLLIMLSVFSLIVLACVISLVVSNEFFKVSEYTLKSEKVDENINLVIIADLHNYTFGKDNRKLKEKIEALNPDAVLMVGDIINSDEKDISASLSLIEALSKKYPVFCSYGNHEKQYEDNFRENIKAQWEKSGATVVEKNYVDTVIKGNAIRIGGIFGYCLPFIENGELEYKGYKSETDYLTDFTDTKKMKLLLCHMPVCFIINGSLDYWDIDYVFSGHAHGGQVKLPFVGAVFAPDQGFFPGKEQGVFTSKNGEHSMILSSGLGSTLPRFNNIPEIISVTITSTD